MMKGLGNMEYGLKDLRKLTEEGIIKLKDNPKILLTKTTRTVKRIILFLHEICYLYSEFPAMNMDIWFGPK